MRSLSVYRRGTLSPAPFHSIRLSFTMLCYVPYPIQATALTSYLIIFLITYIVDYQREGVKKLPANFKKVYKWIMENFNIPEDLEMNTTKYGPHR